MKTLFSHSFDSPLGEIIGLFDQHQLCYLDFADNQPRQQRLLRTRYGEYELTPAPDHLGLAARLQAYFAKQWSAFDGLSLATDGTAFQQCVWQHLQQIPRGQAIDYTTLAKRAERPDAVRAAASANARNPLSVIIPCHRVVGKDGSLRGYAGGERRKRWLLQHEGASI